MSDVNLSSLFSDNEQQLLGEFTQLCQTGVLNTIGSMLGQEFDAEAVSIEAIPDLDTFSLTIAGSGGIAACLEMSSKIAMPFAFFMDKTIGGNIANVLMGMPVDDTITEVDEIQISAVGEVISQMMGSISNNVSQLFGQKVDVSPPKVSLYSDGSIQSEIAEFSNDSIILVTYNFLSSGMLPMVTLYHLISLKDAKELIKCIDTIKNPGNATASAKTTTQAASSPASAPAQPAAAQAAPSQEPVTVQPVQFAPISQATPPPGIANANFELVQDILLRMSVELGRSELTIRDVLDLTRGSVIELDRIAGEAVDLMANGRLIARGEIVVIEDNFGFRVTSIVSPQERLNAV